MCHHLPSLKNFDTNLPVRESIRYVGKSKAMKLNAKAGVVYPLIRLPKTYADQIGKVAEIFETQPITDGHFLSPSARGKSHLRLYNPIHEVYNFCRELYTPVV